jgi:hypothetical protein
MGPDRTEHTRSARRRALVYVETVYAAISVGMAIPLIFLLGPVDTASNGTSIRILGGAVLALGIGAVAVVRDPTGNRAMLRVQLVFAVISALALAWKFRVDDSPRALLLLLPLVVFIVLLLALSPAARPDKGKEPPRSTQRWE